MAHLCVFRCAIFMFMFMHRRQRRQEKHLIHFKQMPKCFSRIQSFFWKIIFPYFFFSFLSSSKTMNLCSKCFAGMFSFSLCSYVFWMYIEAGLVLVETDFSLPKFPPGTLLALTALCHGSWSWSILDSVCISAWQHGGTIKLCPWSSSVLPYGENAHEGCFWHRPLQNCTRQELLTQIVSWIWSICRIKHLKPKSQK